MLSLPSDILDIGSSKFKYGQSKNDIFEPLSLSSSNFMVPAVENVILTSRSDHEKAYTNHLMHHYLLSIR